MAERKAQIGSLTTTSMRIEVSFDAGATWEELVGIYEFQKTGGEPTVENRTPLNAATQTRVGRRGSQSITYTADNLSWMATTKKVDEYLDRDDNFLMRIVRPELPLRSFVSPQTVDITAQGAVTFNGQADMSPDFFESPFAIADLIIVANNFYVVNSVTDVPNALPTVTVDNPPAVPIDDQEYRIARAGGYWGPSEVVGGNLTDNFPNSGSVMQDGLFYLAKRMGPIKVVLGQS